MRTIGLGHTGHDCFKPIKLLPQRQQFHTQLTIHMNSLLQFAIFFWSHALFLSFSSDFVLCLHGDVPLFAPDQAVVAPPLLHFRSAIIARAGWLPFSSLLSLSFFPFLLSFSFSLSPFFLFSSFFPLPLSPFFWSDFTPHFQVRSLVGKPHLNWPWWINFLKKLGNVCLTN